MALHFPRKTLLRLGPRGASHRALLSRSCGRDFLDLLWEHAVNGITMFFQVREFLDEPADNYHMLLFLEKDGYLTT